MVDELQGQGLAEKELLDIKSALDATSIVARADLKGIITYVNDKFCEISQYSREELIGQNHRLLNSGLHPKSLWTDMYRTIAQGNVWRHEVCNIAKDNSLYWVDTTVIGFFNSNQKLDHYISIRTDITARKQLEKELQEQTEVLHIAKTIAENANKKKTEFLAKMSHELRTPMHSIISFSSIGKKKFEQGTIDKLGHYFQRINQSGDRLLALLNNLLDLSKLQSAQLTLELENNIDFSAITESCVSELNSLIKDKSLSINYEVAKPLKLNVDNGLIHQVIVNLLSNAIKFTEENKSITITASRLELALTGRESVAMPAVYCTVSDEGLGIPEQELHTIFEQFVESSRTQTEAGGTGLGLSICKEIVNAHSGQIWAENNSNGGAVIHLLLPINQLSTQSGDD